MTSLAPGARAGSRKAQLGIRMAATALHVAREQLPGWRAPTAPSEVPPAAETLTAQWLTGALCAGHPGAAVVDFAVGSGSDGTSCRRPLRVSYNEEGKAAGLEEQLFTKTTASLRSRLSTGLADMPRSECLFYNRIRPTIDFAGPIGYYAGFDPRTLRSMVIMEDVVAKRGARFGSVVKAANRREAEAMVGQLASYHAAFWEDPRLRGELAEIPTAEQFQARMDSMINFEHRSQVGLQRSRDVVPEELIRRRAQIWPCLRKTFELHRRRPMTLLHQDTHPGNWFRTPGGVMALCDWHGMARGLWAIDFAYAISCGLEIEDRRAWERSLLELYLERLEAAGAPAPTFEEAWHDYSREFLHALVYWLYTIGRGRLQQQFQLHEHCLINIERAAQAIADHETLDRLAEPTTVSNAQAGLAIGEDPINSSSSPELHWTTTNVGEAAPGVQTPLSWTVWQVGDAALREMGHELGILTAQERTSKTAEDRVFRVFYGRSALQVEFLVALGDRMPGATGQEVASSILGRSPDDISYRPTRSRYPAIAWRLPRAFLTAPSRLKRFASDSECWYHQCLRDLDDADAQTARRALGDAARRLDDALTIQAIIAFGVVQPLYGAVEKVVARAGCGDVGVLSGSGGAEISGMLTDLWDASHGHLDLSEVIRRHGFHGPAEGELSSRVWREDAGPLQRRLQEYRTLPPDADPRLREHARRRQRKEMVPTVLAALPRWQRPAVRMLLNLAAERIPLRGVAKRCMLEAFDIARVASACLGEHLTQAGVIDAPDDVYYLTLDELLGAELESAAALIAKRRADRERYQSLAIPGEWKGVPQLTDPQASVDDAGDRRLIAGIGVSSGIVEGIAHVVLDPDVELEPDEILVATTTDPSWATLMMSASALVVDIGGALSHAAVVARELGIPCVVNTRDGTRTIKTGDHIRVDGDAGTIEILAARSVHGAR